MRGSWASLFVLALAACDGAEGQGEREMCEIEFAPEMTPDPRFPEPAECDPLLGPEEAIHIQPPVVVTQLDENTLLVLDRIDGGFSQMDENWEYELLEPRMFLSEGNELVRIRGGLGSSQSTENYLLDAFGADDGSIRGMIRVERKPGMPPHIIPWETDVVIFEDGWPEEGVYLEDKFELGTPLPVLDECTVADMGVQNLPPIRKIEYVATDELGNDIVVTSPEYFGDWDYESFALFYGTSDAMLEHPIEYVAREQDGGTTHIKFDLDGQPAIVHFYVGCNGSFTHDCPGELEVGDTTYEVSIPDDDPALIEGMTFLCHDA